MKMILKISAMRMIEMFSFQHKNRDGNVGCAATAFGSMANILNSKSDRFNSSLVLPLL